MGLMIIFHTVISGIPLSLQDAFTHASNYHTCIIIYSRQEDKFDQNPAHILQSEGLWKEAVPLTKAIEGFRGI